MRNASQTILKVVSALVVVLTLSRAAEAGPPLICHPFDTGAASLLSWGNGHGWNTPDRSYDVQRLTADTLRLLSPDAPVLARMENLRRATIYASRDRRIAAELLASVLGRVQTATAQGSRDPLAWFDAGYLVESYRQASVIYRWDMLSGAERSSWALRAEPQAPDGYGMVQKAIELTGSSPEMEFAASLMKSGAVSAEHRRRAEAGAKAGSLLARNLDR